MKIVHCILLRVRKLGLFIIFLVKRVVACVRRLIRTLNQEKFKQVELLPAPIKCPELERSLPTSLPVKKLKADSAHRMQNPFSLDSISAGFDVSDNMRDLLACRFDDIHESEGNDIVHAGLIVDFMDEVALILSDAAPADAGVLTLLLDRLKDELKRNGGELLFFDTWTPEYQRAVKVERCLPKGSPSLLHEHKSYGFKLNGKLIRKQEVSIQAPIL